jgi:tripartite ATP-independent transporter DctM subunit
MELGNVALIGIGSLLALMLLRMPIAYAMGLVGFLGFAYVNSVPAAFSVMCSDIWSMFSSYNMTVVPLFILMGTVAFSTGIGGRLYDCAYQFIGHFRGGLALATVFACALFGAICGSTSAEAATMGKITLPEMKRYGYDTALATGCVAAAGSLAILIPPSGTLIIYGIITGESIIKLFAAGILPGILLAGLFMIAIYTICTMNPNMGPAAAKTSWHEKLRSLTGIIEMGVLFCFVIGGMFLGWFTPSEAGGAGVGGVFLIGLLRGQLTWEGVRSALSETTRITAMIFLVVATATIFGHFMAITRLPFVLSDWVGNLGVSPYLVMACIVLGFEIAGTFMDELALITLTVPILYPLVTNMGFDGVWFGIIVVLLTEMGLIIPPVGLNVFVIKSVVPEVPLGTIYRGIWPFVFAEIVCTILLIAFPEIALFIPHRL